MHIASRGSRLAPALALMLAACGGSPQKAAQLGELADAQFQAGQNPAARASIDAALKERDDIPGLMILKARIANAQNMQEDAFNAYSSASALDQTNMEALQGVTQLGLAIGKWPEAKAAADKILVIIPSEPSALFAKGLISLSEQNNAEALRLADQILTANPRDTRGLVLKTRVLYSRNRVDEALATLDKGTAGLTELDDPLVATYAELHRDKGDAKALLKDLVTLARIRPADARVRLDQANLRYKLGDAAGARDLILRMLARRDLNPDSITRIVAIWHQNDRDPIASDQLGATAFGTPRARYETARYYLDQGRPADALALLGTGGGEDAQALAARAQLAMGRPPAGPAATIGPILERDATQCDALMARATIAILNRSTRPAITDAQQAAAECPENAGGYRTLAAAMRAAGDAAGEYRAYDDALTNLPQDVLIADEYRARAAQRRDTARVLAVTRQMTRAMPAWPGAWQRLAKICATVGNTACARDAEQRAGGAKTNYRLDPIPGDVRPNGLAGSIRR